MTSICTAGRLLREKEAALYLGCSRDFLRHGRCYGHLAGRTPTPKFRKIGRNVFYEITDLDAWIEGSPRLRHTAEAERYL
jgi:hypothetical protein